MANIIKIKRGITAGIEPAGLTLGELAANLGDGRLFIGGTDGSTIQLLGGGGGGPANIPLATDSLTGVASFPSTDFTVSALGVVSLTSGLVYSVNGQTGNVTLESLPANTPLATNSLTGVASFTGTDFSVSALGVVSLTAGLVRSFNGATGAVTYAPSIATSSVTGVASFNSTYLTVNGSGAVSLASAYQVTGDTVVAGSRISVTRSGNTVTVGNAVPLATVGGVTGVASFSSKQFAVNSSGFVTLSSNFARESQTLVGDEESADGGGDGESYAARFAPSVETNKISLLSNGLTSGVNFAQTVGNQKTTTSTSKILLVGGYREENSFGTYASGLTQTITVIRYMNSADITVYGYKSDNSGSTIKKYMILYDGVGLTFDYSEYANLSRGSNVGTFTVEATGDSWGLFVTPASTDSTVFSVRSTLYQGSPVLPS